MHAFGESIKLEKSIIEGLLVYGNPDGHPNQTGFTMGRREEASLTGLAGATFYSAQLWRRRSYFANCGARINMQFMS